MVQTIDLVLVSNNLDLVFGVVGIKELAKLQKLEWLMLDRTKVTKAGVAELKKALPDCKIEGDLGLEIDLILPVKLLERVGEPISARRKSPNDF